MGITAFSGRVISNVYSELIDLQEINPQHRSERMEMKNMLSEYEMLLRDTLPC